MHYELPGGRLVKSENAAKPASQRSRYLTSLLRALPTVERTLDYGCGKLRYRQDLLQATEHLTVVDSEVQISRTQILDGKRTTIRNLLRASNSTAVFNPAEFSHSSGLYDRAFCINVLSAIPVVETRRNLLQQILKKLKPGASCLFVVQYRNSDFTRMAALPNAEAWEDGFLINSLRGYSFYALISPAALTKMLCEAGFNISSQRHHDGSVYVWAQHAIEPSTPMLHLSSEDAPELTLETT